MSRPRRRGDERERQMMLVVMFCVIALCGYTLYAVGQFNHVVGLVASIMRGAATKTEGGLGGGF